MNSLAELLNGLNPWTQILGALGAAGVAWRLVRAVLKWRPPLPDGVSPDQVKRDEKALGLPWKDKPAKVSKKTLKAIEKSMREKQPLYEAWLTSMGPGYLRPATDQELREAAGRAAGLNDACRGTLDEIPNYKWQERPRPRPEALIRPTCPKCGFFLPPGEIIGGPCVQCRTKAREKREEIQRKTEEATERAMKRLSEERPVHAKWRLRWVKR